MVEFFLYCLIDFLWCYNRWNFEVITTFDFFV